MSAKSAHISAVVFRSILLASFLGSIGCGDDAGIRSDSGILSDAGLRDAAARDAASPDSAAPDAGGDASPDAGTSSLEADFCVPLAEYVCDSAATCGCGALLPGGALDRDGCVARWSARCMSSWQPFVDAGALLDPAAASACIERVSTGTPPCARPGGAIIFAECEPFLVDPAAIGESCDTPYCAGGDGVCEGGMCAMRGAAGADCDDMFGCATGLVCNGVSCVALGEAGAECTVDLECEGPLRCVSGAAGSVCGALGAVAAPCDSPNDCAIGLVCTGGACAAGPTDCSDATMCGHGSMCGGARTCLPRRATGETCRDDRDCEAALYCADGTCAARPGDGETCARSTVCAPGLGCDTDGGTCRPLPIGGAACAFGEMGPICAPGFACVDGSTCGPLPGEGEPCAGVECAPGLGCDFGRDGSICIVPRGEGEECPSDRSCAPELHCGPSGTCEADLPAGEPCSAGNECAGICAPSATGGLACRDRPAAGGTCLFSEDCPDTTACAAAAPACFPEICAEL